MIEANHFVVNKIVLSDVVVNSVGIIKALNGKNGMVLFVFLGDGLLRERYEMHRNGWYFGARVLWVGTIFLITML